MKLKCGNTEINRFVQKFLLEIQPESLQLAVGIENVPEPSPSSEVPVTDQEVNPEFTECLGAREKSFILEVEKEASDKESYGNPVKHVDIVFPSKEKGILNVPQDDCR
ncbi:hypothetical protein TNCT_708661 [Trichonephila clavata]|uniref:Uncharacterized protein n=1 Tax=Trichonephila clavata TaxID=2740835 RepID=A0A8X6KTN1_TRICU|nr:hypothetical protein TNCT_708661 [Trichonephila clavata]